MSRLAPLVNDANTAPPYVAASWNVLAVTVPTTQYLVPLTNPLAVILGITASPTANPCAVEVNVFNVATVVTLICGVVDSVESPCMMLVMISTNAPTVALAAEPPDKFVESVH